MGCKSSKYTIVEAATAGKTGAVLKNIKNGSSINERDAGGRTPLICAAINGNAETVLMLLTQGAHLTPVDDIGFTAIHWASRNGHVPVMRALLNAGADPNARTSSPNENHYTPLQYVPS